MQGAVLFAALAALAFGETAFAGQCAPRASVMATLSGQYGEIRHGIGLAGQNGVIEVFASPATGTWTITLTRPDGLTCLVASGDNYQPEMAETAAPGSPA